MSTDDDSMEVHFNEHRGLLELNCGRVAFARIVDFIHTEALLNDVAEIRRNAISQIDITRVGCRANATPSRWKDRVALFVCAAVAFIASLIFVAGVKEIIQLFKI